MPIHLPINPKNCVFCSFHFCFWVLRISNWYSKDVALDKTIYSAMAYGIPYVSMSLSFAHDQIIELILFCFFFFIYFVAVCLCCLGDSRNRFQLCTTVQIKLFISTMQPLPDTSNHHNIPYRQHVLVMLVRRLYKATFTNCTVKSSERKKIKNNNQSIWTFLVFAAHGRLKRITENTSKMVCLALWG